MKKTFVLIMLSVCLPLMTLATSLSDTAEYTVNGKITYKSGTVVKIQKTDGDQMPIIGQEGTLSKSFETELFGGKMTGWMSIGKMKVSAVAGDIITFTLLKELSEITENGVKKNQFEIGREVKFEWKIPISADEAAYNKGQDAVSTDMDEALGYYREALAINPALAKAYNMVGMVMNAKQLFDSAYVNFKKAADLDTKDAQFAKNTSISAYKAGFSDVAYAYAAKAVTRDSKDGEAYYLRGLMNYLLNKDQLTDALKQTIISDIDMAVKVNPEESFYYTERAFIRNVFGNTTGACEDAKKAKELGVEDADALISTYCQ